MTFPLEFLANEATCVAQRIALDIGWGIAYKRPVPQRGPINGGLNPMKKKIKKGKKITAKKTLRNTIEW